jgi:hypothetical protein
MSSWPADAPWGTAHAAEAMRGYLMLNAIARMVELSVRLVPQLVEEGRRIGKNPYCVSDIAESMAHEILGLWYLQETHSEYLQRHLEECSRDDCGWCRAYRWEDVQ